MGNRRGNRNKADKKKKAAPRVKFAKNATPPAKLLAPKNNLRKAQPHTTWENIVLHYLSKLRGFLAPSSCTSKCTITTAASTCVQDSSPKRTDVEPRKKRVLKGITHHPNKFRNNNKDPNSTVCLSDTSDDSNASPKSKQKKKKKALKIVSAAIDYGCAHGIIENKGKYFWLKNVFNRITNRSLTPCLKKERCKTCKALAQKFSNGHKSNRHSKSNVSSRQNSTTICGAKGKSDIDCSRSCIFKRGSNNEEAGQSKGKKVEKSPMQYRSKQNF